MGAWHTCSVDAPRLLIISFSTLLSDARVRKQIEAFTRNYRVVTCGYGPAPNGVAEHIRLSEDSSPWFFSPALLLAHQYKRAYWANTAVQEASASLAGGAFDAVIANDYETIPLALHLRPRFGVLADMHEYAPSQKENLFRWRAFVSPFRAWLCRTYLPRCAAVTTVGQGIADRYADEFGVMPLVVRNATPLAKLAPTPVHRPLRLVHHGVPHRHRNLEVMLDAVRECSTDLAFDLFLMETDAEYLRELKALYSKDDRIRFHPPVPYADLVPTLNRYDVGIFSLPPVTFNYKMALPNKIFDYVQARLGVIVGPSPEMAALVRRYRVGAVTPNFTAESLRRTLDRLTHRDVELWKKNSDIAARQLHADAEVAVWIRVIDEMVRQ